MATQNGAGNVPNSLFTQGFHGFPDFSRPLSKFQTISRPKENLANSDFLNLWEPCTIIKAIQHTLQHLDAPVQWDDNINYKR